MVVDLPDDLIGALVRRWIVDRLAEGLPIGGLRVDVTQRGADAPPWTYVGAVWSGESVLWESEPATAYTREAAEGARTIALRHAADWAADWIIG